MWSMKKVLIVFNHPAPYKVRLFNELSKSFDLHVIFERDSAKDRDSKFYFENEYNFTTFKIKGLKCGTENLISSGIKKHLKRNRYDLVIMNGYSKFAEMTAISYLKKKHIPYVLYINGGVIKKESSFKKKIKSHYIAGAYAYFSPDENSNNYLTHYGAEKTKIFNYPYSTIFEKEILNSKPNKQAIQNELDINYEKVFVSSGQLIDRKNYLSLVKEWEKFPENYGLFLIGEGNQRKQIETIINAKNIKNVVLTGFLGRNEMFKYFQAADAFLFPSKEDIYGHVINESLSQGLPVISTNKVNSANRLIKDGITGYVLDDLSGEKFNNAVKEILGKDLFNNCIAVSKENTIEKMAECHVKMINEVLSK